MHQAARMGIKRSSCNATDRSADALSRLVYNPRKMVTFEFFVQEGCVTDESRARIVASIEAVCAEVLGMEAGLVSDSWTVIRKGFGFRGGEPSTTSLVRSRIPDGYGSDVRARFLKAIAETWCNLTGATQDEVIVSARDWSWTG